MMREAGTGDPEGRQRLRRIAFDPDETLGVPRVDGPNLVGWQMRPGAAELLDRLHRDSELLLW
jgi:hypothetical protein